MLEIDVRDAEDVTLDNLKPGMVVLEGIVVQVDEVSQRYITIGGPYRPEPDGTVQVIARLTPDSIDAVLEAVHKMQSEGHALRRRDTRPRSAHR